MDPDWAGFLRSNDGPLLFASFFGVLLVLGLLETGWPGTRGIPRGRRWFANAGLTVLFILTNALIPVTLVVAADFAREREFGLLNWAAIPFSASLIAGILARSLTAYLIHRAMHGIPLLWRLHRVHHLDTAVDVSTAARLHPLEAAIVTSVSLVAVVGLGIHPLAVLIYELAEAAFSGFIHANLRLPRSVDRALRLLIVTPGMHLVHHSAWQPETDSNYGSVLSIWDRLFGTYRYKTLQALSEQVTGLENVRDRRAASLPWLLASPALSMRSEAGAATGPN